jgi:tetratricopeptide (TPR) repeat protein
MIEIPPSLVERLKGRQAVLVAGLGCSELAGAPEWDELTMRLCDCVEDEARRAELRTLVAAGRRAAAIAYLGTRLSRDVITEVLTDAYPAPTEVPETIAAIARIPWRGLISTGYDGLWAAAVGDGKDDVRVFTPDQAEQLAEHRGRFLLQLGGSTSAPESLCLGDPRKLAGLGISAALHAVGERRSMVLIGFRPGDPDLKLIGQALAAAMASGGPHFLFVPGERGLELELLEAELGVTAVPHDGALDEGLRALEKAWADVAAQARPAEDDIDTWLEIWGRDPADQESRAVLERAESRLREQGSWERLVELLLGCAERTPDRGQQVAALREVSRVYDVEIQAPDRAFAALDAAFRLDPDAEGLLADVERAAGKANLWGELVADYSEICAELAEGPTAIPHRLELARLYAEELNQVSDAIAEFRVVLARDAKNAVAARALADLLGKEERWMELAPVLAHAADLDDDPARALDLRLQLGEIEATKLDDPDAAIAAYERALAAAGPGAAARAVGEALDALERLYRRRERWADLARTLEAKAARAVDPATAARLRRDRAELLGGRLGDRQAAVRELEAAVEQDPKDRAALRALEQLYENEGRDAEYLRTVERLADLAESSGERLLLLRRLAAEWEGRPDGLDRAADALEQMLQIDPRDADAFRALARVYRQARRWLALAEAATRQIEATDEAVAKRDLWALLGTLYDEELRDPARAAEAFEAAAILGDEREATVAALARLHDQAGRWAPAVDALEKLARATRDPARRTEALVRAAAISAERLGDQAAAESRYARALESDPANLKALTALGALYRGQGQALRAAKLMKEAEEQTTNRIEKVRLLHDLGGLYEADLESKTNATELYARALDVDPEHVPSAERLVELYTRTERWGALAPVLDMLARKADRSPANAPAAAELYVRLGETEQRLGNQSRAARAFETAHQLAPTGLAVLRGLSGLRFERGEHREAAALYRALVEHHDAALPPAELPLVYERLGRCEEALGNRDAAIAWHEKALALDPARRASLEAVAALHGEKGDAGALVLDKRALLALATDDETRAQLSEEIGDLYCDKLGNPAQAITAYQAVLALQPGRRQTLHRLLELYTAEKRWADAAGTLVRMAELEGGPAVRAKYLYTAAVIHRDELGDADGAVLLFNRALDDAPDLTKAFDAVERLLTETGAWKELARNYRRMIKRLPAEGLTDLRLRLWSALGEVSVAHLGDLEMGVTALEVAESLDHANVQRHEQLAEIYLQTGPDHYDKAIAEHQWLIAHNPDRLPSYRALARLYAETGAHDKLWCLAATLTFLRKADPEQQKFFEEHRPRAFRAAKRAFNDQLWQKVVHPDEDRFIAAIFGLLGSFVAQGAAQHHQALGLRRRERVDLGSDDRVPTRVCRYVAETLELPAPDVFFKESDPQSLVLHNLHEKGVLTPALVVGKGAEQRGSEIELVFEMGKRLAYLRPERFVRTALHSPAALDVALRAALALAGSSIGSGAHNGEVDKLTAELRRQVPRPVAEQLAVVGRKLVSARGEVIDVQSWIGAADLTAARVGFALTNDLGAAARVISTEPTSTSPLPARQRLKDLLAYSVSEDYFAVRKFLGLELL